MPDNSYQPKPIATGEIVLPRRLELLLERLAEHVHDIWAEKRMAEGWKFGPARSDAALEHPDLVPFAELTETEKEYDRATARETVRAIVALGYRILPPPKDDI
jgi:ryanodine receptor 2